MRLQQPLLPRNFVLVSVDRFVTAPQVDQPEPLQLHGQVRNFHLRFFGQIRDAGE